MAPAWSPPGPITRRQLASVLSAAFAAFTAGAKPCSSTVQGWSDWSRLLLPYNNSCADYRSREVHSSNANHTVPRLSTRLFFFTALGSDADTGRARAHMAIPYIRHGRSVKSLRARRISIAPAGIAFSARSHMLRARVWRSLELGRICTSTDVMPERTRSRRSYSSNSRAANANAGVRCSWANIALCTHSAVRIRAARVAPTGGRDSGAVSRGPADGSDTVFTVTEWQEQMQRHSRAAHHLPSWS